MKVYWDWAKNTITKENCVLANGSHLDASVAFRALQKIQQQKI